MSNLQVSHNPQVATLNKLYMPHFAESTSIYKHCTRQQPFKQRHRLYNCNMWSCSKAQTEYWRMDFNLWPTERTAQLKGANYINMIKAYKSIQWNSSSPQVKGRRSATVYPTRPFLSNCFCNTITFWFWFCSTIAHDNAEVAGFHGRQGCN